jgi:hypothetical protein
VYFWPSMLGVNAERFPKGGAFLLGLMGCIGNLAIAIVLPIMGQIYDSATLAALPPEIQAAVKKADGGLDQDKFESLQKSKEDQPNVEAAIVSGARQAFRKVSLLAIVLVCIFGSIAVYDRLRGGYKPEELTTAKEFTPAELASDF